MKDILGDTRDQQKEAPSQPSASKPAADPFTIVRGEQAPIAGADDSAGTRRSTRVPRESLVKQPTKLSPLEVLERSMPPELRNASANGKQARPKPPPVPGSARKTRAAAAAEAKDAKQRSEERAKDSARNDKAKENDHDHDQPRRPSKRAQREDAMDEDQPSKATSSKAAAPEASRKEAADTTKQAKAQPASQMQAQPKAPSQPAKAAFSFGSSASPAPSTAAPSLFAAAPPTNKPTEPKQAAPQPMFSFTPPASASKPSRPSEPSAQSEQQDKTPAKATEDPKQAALKVAAVALPSFQLYEAAFSFGSATADQDLAVGAIKDAVREMPVNELAMYELL